MAATLLKTPRRKDAGKISMFLKCSEAAQNKTAVQHLLSHSTRPSKRGELTGRAATSSSPWPWCLHHEARHPSHHSPARRSSRAPVRQQRPRAPQGAGGRGRHTSGQAGLRDGKLTLWLTAHSARQSSEAKHRDLVGDKKRQKGQLCPKRFSAPGFKSASEGSSQKPCC